MDKDDAADVTLAPTAGPVVEIRRDTDFYSEGLATPDDFQRKHRSSVSGNTVS